VSRVNENGLDSREVQPVKSITKYATDFIATHVSFASADLGFYGCCVVLLIQAAVLALVVVL